MKSSIPQIFFAAFAIFCSNSLPANAATVITPTEVIQLTLAHSPALKARAEDILAADARQRQAEAGLMPQLDARAQANHFEGLENSPLAPGVGIPVFENQYSASIGITQPLYTGGRVTNQKRAAALNAEASHHARQASSADLTLTALITYWQWSKTVAQFSAFQSALNRMAALTTDIQNLKQAGLATDNDLLATEVLKDQARLQLEEAQRQADVGRVRLTQLTGRHFTIDDVPLEPSSSTPVAIPPLEDCLAQAVTNRKELASLRLNAQATSALVEASRADRRPQVALIARYEQGNPNNRDFPPDDQWRDDAVIGAAVSWNLFDGGLTRARIAEARSQATRKQLELQAQEEAVLAEVQEAHLNLRHAFSSLETTAHAESSAQRNLEVATDLWKNGAARHSDVLDAEAKLTATNAQRIAAEADIIITQTSLLHAMGVSLVPQQ